MMESRTKPRAIRVHVDSSRARNELSFDLEHQAKIGDVPYLTKRGPYTSFVPDRST